MTTPRITPGTRVGDLLAGGECPRCGTPYDRFQEYCLECGLRLPAEPRTADALAAAVGRPSPWFAGDWLWPALVTLVVAVVTAAGAVALAATRDDDRPTLVATSPQAPTLTGAPPEAPATTAPRVGLPEEEQPPPETEQQPPAAPRRVIGWPAGRNGFTVVLASVPEDSRPAAEERARQALDAGLQQVGVLVSARYPSLHPGYLVVFSGVYPTLARAQAANDAARERGYSDAYAAQVAR